MIPAKHLILSLAVPAALCAQGRGGWTSFGGDAQRTSWNRGETDLAPENVKNLKLEWSIKLPITQKALNGLTPPIVRANLYTNRGVKDFVIVATASDQVFVIDGDTGKLDWQKTLTAEGQPSRPETWLCPNALNATPVIAAMPGGRGQALYLLASDGRLHGFSIITGEQVLPPTPFSPPFAKTWSLNTANNILYTTTSQGCNGVRSGVWAIDMTGAEHKINSFLSSPAGGAGIWGRAGVAITSDGRLVVETGDGNYDLDKGQMPDSVIALSPKDLKMTDYYTPANRAWITRKDLDMGNVSPVVFPFRDWELVAASGKEGVIFLLDSKSLGGADHRTPLYRSPLLANDEVNLSGKGFWGALSTWEDAAGTRWLLAPAWGPPTSGTKFQNEYGPTPNGSVMAFKVELQDAKPVLTPAWNSVDMKLPAPVVIANGVVYALADGDDGVQLDAEGNQLNSAVRKTRTGHAILYALDAQTGKVLYSSGETMQSFSHFSGIAVAGGRVYVTTYDGTVYTFGLGL